MSLPSKSDPWYRCNMTRWWLRRVNLVVKPQSRSSGPVRKGRLRSLYLLSFLLVFPCANGAEYIQSENTAPDSAKTVNTPIDVALEKDEKKIRRLRLDKLKHRLETQPAWLRDAVLDFNLRSYYFKRVNRDESLNEALALGGELVFKTGRIARIARLGLSYYGSYGLDAPQDRGDTGLLGPDQEDLSVLGQAYLQLGDQGKFEARLYRQTLNLPYVNKNDSRMLPNTHEAYFLGRVGTGRDFIVGHVSDIKRRDSETFIPMSQAAGALGTDKGVSVAGLKLDLGADTIFGAFNLYGGDTFNTAYVEGNWVDAVLRRYGIKASAQFTDQRSVGDELVGNFKTNSFGIGLAGSRRGLVLKLAYTQTGEGGAIRSPWGGRPRITRSCSKISTGPERNPCVSVCRPKGGIGRHGAGSSTS